ncbi:hypothetical protein B8W69_29670, partial [Mycobacterium vulneris]
MPEDSRPSNALAQACTIALVMKIGNSGTIPVNTGLFRWVAPNNVQGA